MFGAAFSFTDLSKAVLADSDRAAFKNISHAAASIRKQEIASIQPGEGPSSPGSPPHTHPGVVKSGKRKGQLRQGFLPRSIAFDVDKARDEAVIGPRASIVGESAAAHEFGGEYKDATYPQRPFALPALQANLDRFAAEWQGSIGE